LIADVTAHAVRATLGDDSLGGFYHLAASGQTNWHEYALHLVDSVRRRGFAVKVTQDRIAAVPTKAFMTSAKRPLNSRLDTRCLCKAFGIYPADWRGGLQRALDEILGMPSLV
jgi:dTDP-4-dehydrorhamnose reductase